MIQLALFPDIEPVEFSGDTQECRVCGKDLPFDLFPKHSHHKTGIDTRCKKCIKKQTRLRESLKDKYWHLKQDTCDCCGQESNKTLVLDHDHETLAFRGWICDPCNTGIGKLGDNIQGVQNALNYLERYHGLHGAT